MMELYTLKTQEKQPKTTEIIKIWLSIIYIKINRLSMY